MGRNQKQIKTNCMYRSFSPVTTPSMPIAIGPSSGPKFVQKLPVSTKHGILLCLKWYENWKPLVQGLWNLFLESFQFNFQFSWVFSKTSSRLGVSLPIVLSLYNIYSLQVYTHLIYSTAIPIPAFLVSFFYITLAYNYIYAEVIYLS
jgi:hypothetical protein